MNLYFLSFSRNFYATVKYNRQEYSLCNLLSEFTTAFETDNINFTKCSHSDCLIFSSNNCNPKCINENTYVKEINEYKENTLTRPEIAISFLKLPHYYSCDMVYAQINNMTRGISNAFNDTMMGLTMVGTSGDVFELYLWDSIFGNNVYLTSLNWGSTDITSPYNIYLPETVDVNISVTQQSSKDTFSSISGLISFFEQRNVFINSTSQKTIYSSPVPPPLPSFPTPNIPPRIPGWTIFTIPSPSKPPLRPPPYNPPLYPPFPLTPPPPIWPPVPSFPPVSPDHFVQNNIKIDINNTDTYTINRLIQILKNTTNTTQDNIVVTDKSIILFLIDDGLITSIRSIFQSISNDFEVQRIQLKKSYPPSIPNINPSIPLTLYANPPASPNRLIGCTPILCGTTIPVSANSTHSVRYINNVAPSHTDKCYCDSTCNSGVNNEPDCCYNICDVCQYEDGFCERVYLSPTNPPPFLNSLSLITIETEYIPNVLDEYIEFIKERISIVLGDFEMKNYIFGGYVYKYTNIHIIDIEIKSSLIQPSGKLCTTELEQILNVSKVYASSCLNASPPPLNVDEPFNFIIIIVPTVIVLFVICFIFIGYYYYIRRTRNNRRRR
jgi:hypothetical protein